MSHLARKLIVTGDDFGLTIPVNEAIEEAHQYGILTAASLMVGAEATRDAVERARRLPSLRVGLHVVLVDGRPVLPRDAVPDLIGENGEFSRHLVRAGINFFIQPGIRRQLEREVRAQFEAFRKTGLPLDHVDCHNHMHLHPTLSGIILRVGREFSMRAMRLPYEPPFPSWLASRKTLSKTALTWLFLLPWITLLKIRFKQSSMIWNQFLFGMNDTGRMSTELVLRILKHLPPGVTEIYFHPSTSPWPEAVKGYDFRAELEALTSPAIRQALRTLGVKTIAFSDLSEAEASWL